MADDVPQQIARMIESKIKRTELNKMREQWMREEGIIMSNRIQSSQDKRTIV